MSFLREPWDDLRCLLAVAGVREGRVGIPERPESIGVGKSATSGKCATPRCKSRVASRSGRSIGVPLMMTSIFHFLLLRSSRVNRNRVATPCVFVATLSLGDLWGSSPLQPYGWRRCLMCDVCGKLPSTRNVQRNVRRSALNAKSSETSILIPPTCRT